MKEETARAGRSAARAATLRRAVHGDPDAAAALVRAWGPELTRVADQTLRQAVRSQVDAADIVQDVFGWFFAHPPPEPFLDNPADVLDYLRRATHNRAVDANRRAFACARRNVQRLQSLESLTATDAEKIVSHEAGPAEAAAMADEWAHMLDAQPPIQQVLLVLLRDGFTHAGAAEPLSVCAKTVQRAIADARRSQAVA